MSSSFVAFTVAFLSALSLLPVETFCDSSYYEKYYAARRYVPLKRDAPLQFNFSIKFHPDHLGSFERVALVGNLPALGSWQARKAVLLDQINTTTWTTSVEIPQNSSVEYRYFAAVVGQSGVVRIRHWEAQVEARSFNTTKFNGSRIDEYGLLDGKCTASGPWLQDSGSILQLKVFREALTLEEQPELGQGKLRLRLLPVDPKTLAPILSSARATVEYAQVSSTNTYRVIRDQPEYGVPYASGDILMFQVNLEQLETVSYLVEVYAEQTTENVVRLLGYAHLLPTSFTGSEGSISIDLISPVWQRLVGGLQLGYLVIRPMEKDGFDMRTSFIKWRSNWTNLEIGHRGLGKSLTVTTNAAPLIENTVASMIASAELGADLVEFDVQLTSDLVPIIHHDFSIRVCIDSKTPTSRDDLTEVLLKDISYEQLKDLKTYQIVGNKIVEYPAHNNVEPPEQRLFPTLQDFFERVNQTTGFDIEIKWPQQKADGEFESEQTIDKNLFADRILAVIRRHGCGRYIVIKSFDADLCTLLRYKQNMYPVIFLTSSKENVFADPRTGTVDLSISFAHAARLHGISPNAVFIKADPGLIRRASSLSLVLLWGSDLKDRESIDWFLEQKPTGVIYDRLDLWLPANKTSVFDDEPYLPGYFQHQCDPGSKEREVNSTIESILSNVNLL
ncbi:LOW QUALITY PROTEIN: glycerophosphocholine phosphodiesterase GPCPD1 [Drosophila eugracilis]|uniref:LOW QUALITY PROTEIN: glycerophosphocholine phosphodiesterase GPCPD1 n=1 Tax=Drosophila eugracilis TaxID=29029 RepID=UPI001BD9C93C|nr:LOW QUALITY PROTEIN: glycerophosphocholine phosphodiesterase GPCPD1 [Drosophila eugracilis]